MAALGEVEAALNFAISKLDQLKIRGLANPPAVPKKTEAF
jgi:hypothetical protein